MKIRFQPRENGDRYIRFEWDGGFLEILESRWNRLPEKKKALILEKAVNHEPDVH